MDFARVQYPYRKFSLSITHKKIYKLKGFQNHFQNHSSDTKFVTTQIRCPWPARTRDRSPILKPSIYPWFSQSSKSDKHLIYINIHFINNVLVSEFIQMLKIHYTKHMCMQKCPMTTISGRRQWRHLAPLLVWRGLKSP